MNFEINKYLLNKMGWVTYSQVRGIGLMLTHSLFENDPLVRFFIDISDKKICYIIKELSDSEKQKSKKLYKFIVADYNDGLPDIVVIEFNSNHEMFTLIIEHEACGDEYQRHFKLNKLLR